MLLRQWRDLGLPQPLPAHHQHHHLQTYPHQHNGGGEPSRVEHRTHAQASSSLKPAVALAPASVVAAQQRQRLAMARRQSIAERAQEDVWSGSSDDYEDEQEAVRQQRLLLLEVSY